MFLHYNYSAFLLQLRDMIPTIENPGQWGAFGGAVELGEQLEAAVYRELMEELGVSLNKIYTFRAFPLQNIICHFFYSELPVPLSKLSLNEGVEMGLFTIDEILQESLYSRVISTFFPVSSQFLDFFNEFSEIYEISGVYENSRSDGTDERWWIGLYQPESDELKNRYTSSSVKL